MRKILGNGTLDNNQWRYDEKILAGSDGTHDEILIVNIHGSYHYNLEITSVLNQIQYQRYWICWIWVDRSSGDDETDLMTLFEKDRILYESKSDPCDPYNLELTSILSPISYQYSWSDFEKKKILGNMTLNDNQRRYDENESDGKMLAACNLFPLHIDNTRDPWDLSQ